MKIIITTPNLYLRESTPNDATLAYQLNLDPDVILYTGDPPFFSVEEARIFLENYDAFTKYNMGRWYTFLKETNEFVGWCGLKYSPDLDEVDLGYRLLKKHWGKGYGTEAAAACLDYGFKTLAIEKIIAKADKRNIASIRIMQKIGMQHEKDILFDQDEGVMYKATKLNWGR